jgi:hypothetical protein
VSYDERTAHDARYFILRELTEQIDGQSNSIHLRRVLDAQGIRRDPDWVVTQVNKLGQLGAVKVTMAGDIAIASIEPLGRHHVDQRTVIAGVSKLSDIV